MARSQPSAQWRGLEQRRRDQLTKGTEAGAVDGKGAVVRTLVWTRRGQAGVGHSLACCKSRHEPWAEPQRGLQSRTGPWESSFHLGLWHGLRAARGAGRRQPGSAGLCRAGGVSAEAHAHVCAGSGFRAYTGHPWGRAWGGACIQVASEAPLG